MKSLTAALSRFFNRSGWRGIETARFDREIDLAVIDGNTELLGICCIRHADDWLDAETLKPIKVTATHWRFRWPLIFPVSCC